MADTSFQSGSVSSPALELPVYGTFVVGREGETLGYASPFEGDFTDVPEAPKWVPAVLASGPDGGYVAYPPTVPVAARAAGSSPTSAAGVASPFVSPYSRSSATPYSFSTTSSTGTEVYKGGTVGAHMRSAAKSAGPSSQLEKRTVYNPENPFSVRPSHELPGYDDWISKRSPDGRLQAPAQPRNSNYRSYAVDHGEIKVVDLQQPAETPEQARERKEKMSLEEMNELMEAERLENQRKREESRREMARNAKEKEQRKLAALTRDEDQILGDTGLKDVADYQSIDKTPWTLPVSPEMPKIDLEDDMGKGWVVVEECRYGNGGIVMSRQMKKLHPDSAGREAFC